MNRIATRLQPLLLCLLALAGSGVPAQQRSRLSSFPEGLATIDHLLLHFDPNSVEGWLPACRDLVLSLPREVRITIAVHGPVEREQLKRILAAQGIKRPEIVIVGRPITQWARDRMIAVGNGSLVDLLTPRADCVGPDYTGDLATASTLADRHGCRAVPVALEFEGGDIVCGGKHTFIGWDTIRSNSETASTDDTIRAFQRLLCSEVVVVGRPVPPHIHVDMYLTMFDQNTVMLGDPIAGGDLLEKCQQQTPLVALPSFDTWTIAAQQVVAPQYEEVWRELHQRGLRVLRVPILHGEQGGVLTWNNALVERRGAERRVYLPVYGVPLLDDEAARAFRDAGSRVFAIDVSGIAPDGGTVRCITNVLAWSSPSQPKPIRSLVVAPPAGLSR